MRDPADGFTVPLRDLGDETPAWRGILAPVDAPRDAPAGVTAQFLEHAADYHERYANVAHFRTVLRTLETADAALFRLLPFTRRYAWQVVVILEKPLTRDSRGA